MKSSKLNIKSFSRNHISIIIFLSSALFLVFLLPANVSSQIKHGIGLSVMPFQKVTVMASNNLSDFFGQLFSFRNSEREDELLKRDVFRLKNLVIKQSDIIYRLKNEIKSLSDFYDIGSVSVKPIMANIIGYDAGEFRKSILLDVGTKHGVAVNDTVVNGNALVGRVFEAAPFTSRVQLITDPDIRVPARVLETRDKGIVTGNSGFVCRMEYVPETANVKEGDRIVTSGDGENYATSIYIGTVTKSEKVEGQLFLNVSVRPVVNLSKMESVLIIRHAHTPDAALPVTGSR
ncbi:MAG: rod shape-determining protein MreC [Candidatus Anammoxibacter sp.]